MSSEGLNRILLIGNLGRDPEPSVAQDGESRAAFSLAVTTFDRATKLEATEWIPCVLSGRTAEAAVKILHKGSRVFIEGHWRALEYPDKSGAMKTHVRVHADRFICHEPAPHRSESGAEHALPGFRGAAPGCGGRPPPAFRAPPKATSAHAPPRKRFDDDDLDDAREPHEPPATAAMPGMPDPPSEAAPIDSILDPDDQIPF